MLVNVTLQDFLLHVKKQNITEPWKIVEVFFDVMCCEVFSLNMMSLIVLKS